MQKNERVKFIFIESMSQQAAEAIHQNWKYLLNELHEVQ